MREKDIESKLRTYATSRGVLFWKFTSPGHDGVPDRIVISPSGRVAFMELKAPGKKPTPLQLAMHNVLRAHNVEVHVVDNYEKGEVILAAFALC